MAVKVTVRTEVRVAGQTFRVLRCSIDERLSTMPSLTAEVTTDEGAPDPSTLVGKALSATIARDHNNQARCFAGIVVEATRLADKDGNPTVVLSAAPKLWRLGKRTDCRIFQEMSTVDIVKEVLSGAGVTDHEWNLVESYEPRTYTVQYRETDLDFIGRLLGEEGIYFTIRHEDEKDTVVFGDNPVGLGVTDGESTLPFVRTFGFEVWHDCVMWVEQRAEVRSDKVFTRRYDFERPRFKLEASVEGKDDGAKALEVYHYPARTTDEATLKRHAQVLLDSMQAERDVVRGQTTVLTLRPGYRFTLKDHPYEPLNQEYLVTRIELETRDLRSFHRDSDLDGRDCVCRFTAVPTSTTAYRPPRAERSQVMPELTTAFTTGPSGSEIHTDKHGRVKARFHWDRLGKNDDTSSTWMRTSQVPTGGSMLLPRVGWEVTVRHVEGDVDQPVVMGRVYTATTVPPYGLPGGKARSALQTATTPGGGSSNEFRMDDTKGNEEMMFNASKDMGVDVKNNTTESIGNNESRDIGGNRKLNVTNSVTSNVGANATLNIGGNQNLKVETFMVDDAGGDHSLSIGGNRDMKVGGDHKRTVGGASSLTVGGNSTDLVVGSVNESTMASMNHTVGTALVEVTAGNRSVVVGGSRTENTGAVKAVISGAGRGVDVGAALTTKVAGAILTKIGADRVDTAGAMFTEVAAGAQIVKADNVVFEAEAMLTVVMGASTVTLLPAVLAIAGVSVKLDGDAAETAALVIDN